MSGDVKFGITASAAGPEGWTDKQQYESLYRDIETAAELGYVSVWMIEHHFSNYFPQPNPLMALSNISGRFPQLELGTSVLVTPWHNPVRLAEEIAMLANISDRNLNLGVGRGTAKFEFDAFGLELGDSQALFEESMTIIQEVIGAKDFTFQGEHFSYPEPIELRPRVEDRSRIKFFGALGSPSSAEKIARMGMAPLSRVTGDVSTQLPLVNTWREAFRTHHPDTPLPTDFPIQITTIIEDTDEQALDEAKIYTPKYMQAQLDHYTPGQTDWSDKPDYAGWLPIFKNMERLTDPDNIPSWVSGNFVGSPESVADEVVKYIDAGFNHFAIQTATPGVPSEKRTRWLTRFYNEVLPLVRERVPGAFNLVTA